MSTETGIPDGARQTNTGSVSAGVRIECAIAAALFAFALTVFVAREWRHASPLVLAMATLLFGLLTGTTLSLSVASCRDRLRSLSWLPAIKLFAAPAVITLAIALYSLAAGLSVATRTAAFGLYLALPAVILLPRRQSGPAPFQVLAAAAALWLPIEFRLLPPLQVPPGGFGAAPLAALTDGLFLFLVARPLDRIGYTFRLSGRDVSLALLATAAFALVGIPIGLGTRFLEWHPQLNVAGVAVVPVAIYLVTAVPEEFLFRGLIQNALERSIGRAGLPVAAIIFGFAHLPDLRYVVLASLAGVAYGWVYARTRRITASAITHALVDWIWVLLLRQ